MWSNDQSEFPLMRRSLSALACLSLLALAPACDVDDDGLGDDFRDFNINIQMTMADGGSDDGSMPWEIVEAEVYAGPAAEANLLLYIEGNKIYTAADDTETCHVNAPFINSSIREVVGANGNDVLFTVWGNYVFDGEIDPKYENFGQIKKMFGDQLLFEYETNEIFWGEVHDGFRLMTTNVDIEVLGDDHKLLMAALMTGHCGSAGLPGYTF